MNRSTRLGIFLVGLFALGGCGSDDANGGGTGNAAATEGGGGSGGSDPADGTCATLCGSPCLDDIDGAPIESVQDCIDACAQSELLFGCEDPTATLITCLETNDCNTVDCAEQAVSWGECVGELPQP